MIGLKKERVQGESVVKKVKFAKFRLYGEEANALSAVDSLNCDCREGRLRAGIATAPHYISQGTPITVDVGELKVVAAYDVRLNDGKHTFFFVASDGYLYTRDSLGVGVKRAAIGDYSSCHLLRDEQKRVYCLLAGAVGAHCTEDGSSFTCVGRGRLNGACAAEKRFFLLYHDGTIAYCAPFVPTEWGGDAQEGGELYLPASAGEGRAIASHGKFVYVFAERSIYRIAVKAKASDFVVERLDYDGGEIVPRSAVSTGMGICFLAESGLYYLRGDCIERRCAHLPVTPKSEESARIGYCANTVMLEYSSADGMAKRLVVSPDAKDGFFYGRYGQFCGSEYFYSTVGIKRFVREPVQGVYSPEPYFETGWENLGSFGGKTLKRLTLRGRGEVRVCVCFGAGTHEYFVTMTGGKGEVRLCERGETFAFRLFPQMGCEVENMTVEYVQLKG